MEEKYLIQDSIHCLRNRIDIIERNMKEEFEAIKALLKANESKNDPVNEFSQKTHLHGFIEFNESKSRKWKYFWGILILTSLIISSYLIVTETITFFNTPVTTVVTHGTKDLPLLLPTVKICYSNWLQWFDFKRALGDNFTKEEITFALSFLHDVYSEKRFDYNFIMEEFPKKLTKYNMKTIKDFYSTYLFKHLIFFPPDPLKSIWFPAISNPLYCQIIHNEYLPIKDNYFMIILRDKAYDKHGKDIPVCAKRDISNRASYLFKNFKI